MDSACSMCGKPLAQDQVLYTDEGKVICNDCNAKREIQRDERRAANNIKYAAITSLVAGMFGLAAFRMAVGLFFYAGAVFSIASAVFVIQGMMTGNERFTAYLSPGTKTLIWACTGVALAIAVLECLAYGGYVHFLGVL